jgi:hypothetical protein
MEKTLRLKPIFKIVLIFTLSYFLFAIPVTRHRLVFDYVHEAVNPFIEKSYRSAKNFFSPNRKRRGLSQSQVMSTSDYSAPLYESSDDLFEVQEEVEENLTQKTISEQKVEQIKESLNQNKEQAIQEISRLLKKYRKPQAAPSNPSNQKNEGQEETEGFDEYDFREI